MKEDASILCDSEFRAQALVRQNFIQWSTYLLIYKLDNELIHSLVWWSDLRVK